MKNFFHKDVIFSTLFVFLLMYLLKLMVFNINFLNPIANALKDFEFNDIYFSRLQDKDPAAIDTNIIIVNIGYDSREEIARKINILEKYKPAVIALDVTFETEKDPRTDSLLASSIAGKKNIVIASYFDYIDSEVLNAYVQSIPLIRKEQTEGFINFTNREEESTIRNFTPSIVYQDNEINGFAAEIVKKYDNSAYIDLMRRGTRLEKINYKGNMESYIVFDTDEIDPFNPRLRVIKNKIVLMGFTGADLHTKVLEDIHFTPLNHKYSGKSFPDMYGVIIHANIIHTILAGNYVSRIPLWFSLIISFMLTYVCMYYFIHYYVKWVIWYQLIARGLQLLLSVVLAALSILLFRIWDFQLSAMIIIIPILLSIDVMEIYEGIVLYLNKKTGYKTLFRND